MIVVKWPHIKRMPESCDDCIYFATRPCPVNGWVDLCELANEQLTDNKDDDWNWGGDERPKNCLLMEVES